MFYSSLCCSSNISYGSCVLVSTTTERWETASFLFPLNKTDALLHTPVKLPHCQKSLFVFAVRRDLLVMQTVIKSQNQKGSFVSLISLSRLLVCTLSGGFIQHPCPALFTSYFLYYSLSTFWRQSGWALEPCLSSNGYHFCVIRGLCLTQIKMIRPLFKWYVPTAGPGCHVLTADTLILFQVAINGKTSPHSKLGLIIPVLIF